LGIGKAVQSIEDSLIGDWELDWGLMDWRIEDYSEIADWSEIEDQSETADLREQSTIHNLRIILNPAIRQSPIQSPIPNQRIPNSYWPDLRGPEWLYHQSFLLSMLIER